MENITNKSNLLNTYFLDYETDIVKNFIELHTKPNQSKSQNAVSLYYAVRDKIKYDPYHIILKKENIRASEVINRKYGYCVEKALVMVACMRGIGIPSKIGFANVKNHLSSPRLFDLMKTDVFVFHGYADIFLNGKWVKATPAFNSSLCEKTNTLPLEFDGNGDSIFHSFDREGKKHMEYLQDFGSLEDLPFERMMEEYERFYPHLNVRESGSFGNFRLKASFEEEATS